MASYVKIYIDTVPPKIEIISPKYVSREMYAEIIIQANEKLGSYQEIYTIDSLGVRRDYIFQNVGNRLIGLIPFHDYPYGIVTIYVQVNDEVGNLSKIETANLEVRETTSRLKVCIRDYNMCIDSYNKKAKVCLNDKNMRINSVQMCSNYCKDVK